MSTEDYDYMSDSDLEDVEEDPAEDSGPSKTRQIVVKMTMKQADGTEAAGAGATPASEEVSGVLCSNTRLTTDGHCGDGRCRRD